MPLKKLIMVVLIDNLITRKLKYWYTRIGEREDMDYYSGILDAYYHFAYYIADDYQNTVADAMFILWDDMSYYKTKRTYFARGYVRGIKTLFDNLREIAVIAYGESYSNDEIMKCGGIFDDITIESFSFVN